MRNRDILRRSLIFPIKKYKHFMVVTALFLFMELIQHFLLDHVFSEYIMMLVFFVHMFLPLIILGINLQIIYHILNQNRGLPSITIKNTIAHATKDTLIDLYYLGVTILITAILVIPTGLYRNIYDVYTLIKNLTMNIGGLNVIQVMGTLPDVLLINYLSSITISTIIFLVTFIILFSFCSLSKIDLLVHQKYKQSFNLKRMVKIIKKIGIIKYLGFIFLIIVLSVIIVNVIYYLTYAQFIGSVISAVLESFSLFFFIYSFTLLYPDELIPK